MANRPSSSHFYIKHTYIIFLIMVTHVVMISSNPEADALLLLKKSFVNAQALDSWQSGAAPCTGKQWAGLVCENGAVSGLRLHKMELSGKIDINALLQMPNLRSLVITNNSFDGPIPEVNKMGALRGVYLSANQFSGEIPSDYFKNMASLKKLYLSDNNFTGNIPLSLSQLPHLVSLHLDHNKFSGAIPEFSQANLVTLDLSNNNLDGEIPPSLSKFNASSFEGNAGLCGGKLEKPCNVPQKWSNIPSKNLPYGLLALCMIILVIMAFAILLMRRKQQQRLDGFEKERLDDPSIGSTGWRESGASKNDMADQSVSSTTPKLSSRKASRRGGDLIVVNDEKGVFGLADLMKAAAEVLGNGSVGSSYKAMLSNGFVVVVKRVKEMNKLDKEDFEAEITHMAGLRHPNILTPLAYHYRKEEKLLVSEYIPKGSLLYILHGDRGPCHAELTWPVRLKIIKGIANGLSYLHTEYVTSDLPHGDLKSSNVLIASNYEPLLADYGLNSMISSNQVVQSLFAYKSPEVLQQNLQVSPKCDVYCLGIIILEMLTGKFPSQYLNHGNGRTDVVDFVKSAILEGREHELVDPEIVTANNALGEMQKLLHVGTACTDNSPEKRLDLREATKRIEAIQLEGAAKMDDKKFNHTPTSRDGYTDGATLQSQASNLQRGSAQSSYGDQVLQQNGDSSAFQMF